MHILAGLDKPTEGTVSVAGIELTELNDGELTKLRREHVGFIFQFFNLLPMLTARENIVLPLNLAGAKSQDGWVEELSAKVGLTERLAHRPAELSGGQQQRVAIARALVSRPTVALPCNDGARGDRRGRFRGRNSSRGKHKAGPREVAREARACGRPAQGIRAARGRLLRQRSS